MRTSLRAACIAIEKASAPLQWIRGGVTGTQDTEGKPVAHVVGSQGLVIVDAGLQGARSLLLHLVNVLPLLASEVQGPGLCCCAWSTCCHCWL